jgi:hypothetical protein
MTETQGQQQEQPAQPAGASNTGQDQAVPYARFSEVISERNELRQRIEALETARKADDERRLAEQQEWQKLAEQRAARITELEPLAKRVEEVQEALQATVKARVDRIPEDLRGMVPEYDDPRKTLAWLDVNEARLSRPVAPQTDAGVRGDAPTAQMGKLTDDDRQMARLMGIPDEEYAQFKARRDKQDRQWLGGIAGRIKLEE